MNCSFNLFAKPDKQSQTENASSISSSAPPPSNRPRSISPAWPPTPSAPSSQDEQNADSGAWPATPLPATLPLDSQEPEEDPPTVITHTPAFNLGCKHN